MFKKNIKTMSLTLLCSSLLLFNSAPVLASESASANVSDNIKVVSMANMSNKLVDGGSCTQTIEGKELGVFSVTVSDSDLRNLTVDSDAAVKISILPDYPVYQNYASFNSGEYRMFNTIGWHFIPMIEYKIFVEPETTADVTISMSRATSALSWINVGNGTINEKNLLQSGQVEQYGLTFKTSGTYRITVHAAGKLFATYGDGIDSSNSKAVPLDKETYVFDNLEIKSTGIYMIVLANGDPQNSGSTYTVTIEKIN